MAPIIPLVLLAGLPVVLIFIFKSDGAVAFLALCAGSVLAKFVSSDTTNVLKSFVPSSGSISLSVVQLVLLLAPVVFTILFMKGSVSGAKAMFNLIPAITTGLVAGLLAVPLLPGGTSHNITTSTAWSSIDQYQSVIVAIAVLISLFSLWFTKSKPDKKGKHK